MSDPRTAAPETAAINVVLLAVRQAADVLCDRWTMSVLLCAFTGVSRFNDFRAHTGMASRQLTQRLTALEAQGILVRMPYSTRPLRYGSHLTTMGEALFDVVACMVAWEERHGHGPGSPGVQIKHRGCAAARSAPKLICTECEIPVYARDVENPRTSQPSPAQLPEKKANYRRTAASRGASEARLLLPESLEIVGDKWTIEILVIVFMRVGKFVDIQRLSGISSNVLSDRLGCLMRLGLLRQAAPDEDGLTGSYRITEKGLAFYPVLLALQAWADAWLPDRVRSPLRLRHTPCGRQLKLAVVCDACNQMIDASACEVLLES